MSYLVGLALSAALLVGPTAVVKSQAADWEDLRGRETAGRIIDGCLARAGLNREAYPACVEVAFHTCLRDNAWRDSTHGLNVCRRASGMAWQARYDAVMARFETVFRAWERQPDDKRKPEWKRLTPARFRAQEKDWLRWAAADCEMRELGSIGGSIHSYDLASCEMRHIAGRTIDLMPVIDFWETH